MILEKRAPRSGAMILEKRAPRSELYSRPKPRDASRAKLRNRSLDPRIGASSLNRCRLHQNRHDTRVTDPTGDPQTDPMTQSRVQATLKTLFARIWDGVKANRTLVGAVLLVGFLEALFTKAPLLLVKFLVDALAGTEPVTTQPEGFLQSVGMGIEESFLSFSHWVHDLFGLTFDDPAMVRLLGCAAAAIIMGLVGSFAIYGTTVLSRYFAAKVVVDLRNEVLDHILRLPMRFFAKRRMGDLISNITTDTAVLTRSFTLACNNAVTDPLSILFNFGILGLYFPQLLPVLVIVVPVMALPMLRAGKRIHKSSSKSLAAMGDSTEAMNQMLSGIRTVKAFQLEEERLQEYREYNARYLRRTKRMLKAKGFSQGFLFVSYQTAFALLLCGMGWLIISGSEKPGDIAIALVPLATTYQHVKRLARSYNILAESVGAIEGIESILGVDPDAANRDGGEQLTELRGDVEMDNVSFAYESEQVLDGVSLKIRSGQTIALVGPSGAGKTTVMNLLARFYDPTSGRVLVDGRDLREINLQSYRRHVAIVSQQPFLFNTTILENIRYGRRDATDKEIYEAARQAQIHDFIVSLPEGYLSIAGERGSNLSGGQMQRITIARAIVRDPRVLFLDEAMSNLDSESEEAVQKALESLMEGRTSFVIAHRLSTIQSADVILVMENGNVVERGAHEELVGKGGLYQRLCELQQL